MRQPLAVKLQWLENLLESGIRRGIKTTKLIIYLLWDHKIREPSGRDRRLVHFGCESLWNAAHVGDTSGCSTNSRAKTKMPKGKTRRPKGTKRRAKGKRNRPKEKGKKRKRSGSLTAKSESPMSPPATMVRTPLSRRTIIFRPTNGYKVQVRETHKQELSSSPGIRLKASTKLPKRWVAEGSRKMRIWTAIWSCTRKPKSC